MCKKGGLSSAVANRAVDFSVERNSKPQVACNRPQSEVPLLSLGTNLEENSRSFDYAVARLATEASQRKAGERFAQDTPVKGHLRRAPRLQ